MASKPKQRGGPPQKPSRVVQRSLRVDGHKTSVSLEDSFWNALKEIASTQEMALQELILKIDQERKHANLSSAIRLYVLSHYSDRHGTKT